MTAQIFIATSAPSAEETSQSTAAENVSQPQSMSTDPRNPTAIQGEPLPAEGASEMVFSGRSAGSRAGPLQSTAPTAPPVQSGRSAVNHGGPLQSTPPIERRVLEEEDQPLFFGDSSPREHDLQLESHTLLQDTMDEVNGRPTTQSASQVLADMAIEIPLAGEEEEKEDSDGEFPPSDDELPSTQQETSSKRAKVCDSRRPSAPFPLTLPGPHSISRCSRACIPVLPSTSCILQSCVNPAALARPLYRSRSPSTGNHSHPSGTPSHRTELNEGAVALGCGDADWAPLCFVPNSAVVAGARPPLALSCQTELCGIVMHYFEAPWPKLTSTRQG